jgi:hypothetical protein
MYNYTLTYMVHMFIRNLPFMMARGSRTFFWNSPPIKTTNKTIRTTIVNTTMLLGEVPITFKAQCTYNTDKDVDHTPIELEQIDAKNKLEIAKIVAETMQIETDTQILNNRRKTEHEIEFARMATEGMIANVDMVSRELRIPPGDLFNGGINWESLSLGSLKCRSGAWFNNDNKKKKIHE